MSLSLGKNASNVKQPLHLDSTNHLLVNDSTNKAVLDQIATNTANINVNVGDVEINVADLEALQATTNTTLAAILVDTDAADSSLNTIEAQSVFTASRLNNIQNKISANTDGTGDTLGQIANSILAKNTQIETLQTTANATLASILADTDAADSSLNTIEAQSVLTASRLNNIQNKISANTDGTGNTLGQIANSILTKNGEIETSMNSLISANHTDLVALEASLTSMEAKQDTMIGHNDGVETLLTAIDGRVDGLETLQGTTNTHLSEIEGAVETLEGCVSGTELQVDIVGGNITGFATETTLGAAEAHLGNIETAVQLLDNAISGNEMQVDIVGGNITGFATETTLGAAEAHLGNIETAVQLLDNAISGNEMQVDIVSSALPSGASTLAKQDTIIGHVDGIETLLGTIDADTGAIKTAVEILDNAISGNEMQVDIVTSALPSGASTLAKQDDIIGHVNGIEGLLGTIDADTGAIKTAVELIDDAIKTEDLAHSSGDKGIPCLMVRQDSHSDLAADGDYMIPTINANGEIRVTSTAASGGSTEAKQDTIIGHLDGVEGKLDTLETTLTAIETDQAAIEVLLTAANVDHAANEALLTTIDADTNDIKTNTAACATDLAALEVLQTTIKNDAMVETVIFNAQINASATGTSSAFERPRNATNWAILIENTSDSNGNHEINLSRSVNDSFYITPSTDHNTVGDSNNVIEFTSISATGTNKYYKIVINNQDSSNHTYKVTVCA